MIVRTVLFFLLMAGVAVAAEREVSYEMDGQTYQGFWASSKADAPFLLLVHDWDGLTDYEVKRAKMLADLGYSVFAVDLFGAGVRPESTEEKKKLTGALYQDRTKMRALLQAGLAAAQREGARLDNAVAFGYCFGGAVVLELARSGANLKGFVSFHGGLTTPEGQDYRSVRGEILVLHGTADASVSMAEFAKLATDLEQAGVRHEMISYAGAPHAFTVFGSERYRKDADTKSWRRFSEFLAETLR